MTLTSVYTYKQISKLRHPGNYYSKKEIDFSRENPTIIHFTTCLLNIRPWQADSKHPYAPVFKKYKQISPWADRPENLAKFTEGEYKVISKIFKLPEFISFSIIGLLHARLKPLYIITKSKLS
jgi:hypothetical protein